MKLSCHTASPDCVSDLRCCYHVIVECQHRFMIQSNISFISTIHSSSVVWRHHALSSQSFTLHLQVKEFNATIQKYGCNLPPEQGAVVKTSAMGTGEFVGALLGSFGLGVLVTVMATMWILNLRQLDHWCFIGHLWPVLNKTQFFRRQT